MKILVISPNTKKNNINNIISSNTDSIIYNTDKYDDFIESFNDEFNDLLNDKNTFIKYIEMNNPNDEINNNIKNEINLIEKNLLFNNKNILYHNCTIHIDNNYSYVMYYNNVMYDLIKNNILNENDINNKYMNLLSTYIKYDYNIQNDILLGDVYILKYDNNHNLIEINNKEFTDLVYKKIFFRYYSGYCNNIVLGNKLKYKSIINNDETDQYDILYDKKIVKFIKDNVKTIFKYELIFNDYINNNNIYIEHCDKYNILLSNNIKYCFSWCDIDKNDIENIL